MKKYMSFIIRSNYIKYVLLIFAGILLILLCSTLQRAAPLQNGEYYFSSFLMRSYTKVAVIIYFITGVIIGYYLKVVPWFAGFCLILIFPVTSLFEAIMYIGTHNLIPFEFFFHFLFALPSIIGIYIGKFIFKRASKRIR